MLNDYLFIGSTFFLLLIPIILYFLTQNSANIQRVLTQQNPTDDKKLQIYYARFHILFKIVIISTIVFSLVQLVALTIVNYDAINSDKLIKVDLVIFLLTTLQFIFALSNLVLIIFSFLYFRLKPSFRHPFIQRYFFYFSLVFIVSQLSAIVYYFLINSGFVLPELLTYSISNTSNGFIPFDYYVYVALFILFVIFNITYRRFVKNRNSKSSRIYLITHLLTFFVFGIILYNFGIKYFDIVNASNIKLLIFHYRTYFIGLILIYLFLLSFYGIIFSVFIYQKKAQFIGSQFSISYTLKLARINYLGSLALFILINLPWILIEYYSYF